ncbi:MAG: tetrathionate reductase family octaheme c-type cytochrome [Magnetococcales bacterium]|nr:tetrathionate reductase family octaheme c-type cytochrome [Magnetococcales bacterium]
MERLWWLRLWGAFLIAVVGFQWPLQAQDLMAAHVGSTTSHDKLPALDGPFDSGREVTRACLGCHTEAASAIRGTVHWTWEYSHATLGKTFGKKNVFNTFCGSVVSNMRECTSCHIGYGWQDPGVTEVSDDQVDCLVCHEKTGKYKKYNYGSAVLKFRDKVLNKPDFVAMARSVGRPGRANCGFCHFHGGSGDGAKHGDLDSSLIRPDRFLDVHMQEDGLNFTCVTCHNAPNHQITGSRYTMKAQDPLGIDRPGRTDGSRSSCASCHGNAPHRFRSKLNDHVDRVACQTCHIPAMARGGVATMVHWDWRWAGQNKGNTDIPEVLRTAGHLPEKISIRHSRTHGTSLWGENLTPRYAWFNGRVDYLLRNEPLDPEGPIQVNRIFGSAADSSSRIWPFKNMWAMLPVDSTHQTLAVNHTVKSDADDKEAFEHSADWQRSVAAGMAAAGLPFSGAVGFRPGVMYFPLTHMIAPREQSLKCRECHMDGGRMDGVEGIYMPGRNNNPLLQQFGRGCVLLTLIGMTIHASLRIVMRPKRRLRTS